jgi:CBS domain containing-hemolysin-like protein
MIGITSGIVLIVLAVLLFGLQRLYSSIPAQELKRLARRGDQLAAALYRPVAYGVSLRVLLWVVGITSLSVGLLLVLPHMPAIADVFVVGLSLTLALVLMPSIRLTVRTAEVAAWVSPAITWVLGHTHQVFDWIAKAVNRYRDMTPHSKLYEKEDLQHLLTRQKEQLDNRIAHHELELVERALAFDDRQAADILQPHNSQHFVDADDTIGPILLDQLHKSKQSSFLVYKDMKENIIGSLSMRDAVAAKHDGRVFDLVRYDLMFVHEDFSLRQVMTAFQRTAQPIAVVINSFEEFVGIITFESLLNELLGEAEDELDAYDNRSAIAAFTPKKKQDKQQETESTNDKPAERQDSSPEATEVVE